MEDVVIVSACRAAVVFPWPQPLKYYNEFSK
jgi:hypothetical protein